jgi:hypothetical protein
MKKLLFLIFIAGLGVSCDNNDPGPQKMSFKVDGVLYQTSNAQAFKFSNLDGTFDILINVLTEEDYTFSIAINDKPLKQVYGEMDIAFSLLSPLQTFKYDDCNSVVNPLIVFEELTASTDRITGTFAGLVCDANNTVELVITEGVFKSIRLQ